VAPKQQGRTQGRSERTSEQDRVGVADRLSGDVASPGSPPDGDADRTGRPAAWSAGVAAGVALAIVYAATLAPDVTLWDAGEFVAAASSFGIPHPPGTPLYLLLARAAVLLAPDGRASVALGVLSALATAAACAVGGALVAGWLRDRWAGVAAALAAGTASAVWLNATEPEVYSLSLLLGALALLAADRLRRATDADAPRLATAGAYALALAVPLHLSALAAAPAAVVLAAGGAWRRHRFAFLLAAAAVIAAGAATASAPVAAAGLVALLLAALLDRRLAPVAAGVAGVLAIAGSALLVLILRARHDPAVNQGNPATLAALAEVVGRTQYQHAGVWPRQAPLWLQLANVFEYADWQFALALAPGATPTVARTAVTLLFVALAYVGARTHRRADPGSWRATAVLLASTTLGLALYLNFKAGPSIGWGVLPDDAPHEARERDYFFALAFWAWGLWAGVGARTVARRLATGGRAAALAVGLAALPVALNWAAVSRRQEPGASLARRYALALLEAAPPRAVLFAAGDNDSYPAWYAQQSLGLRRDVTVVTVPLLPAPWYRAELARRHALLAPRDTATWFGEPAVLASIASRARSQARPVAATAMLDPVQRAPVGGAWLFDGLVYRSVAGDDAGVRLDAAAAARHARALAPLRARPLHAQAGGAARYVFSLLGCPAAVGHAGRDRGADSLLATLCGRR
jgi:hypothetical protein